MWSKTKMSQKKRKLLQQYTTISFFMLLAVSILSGFYQGFYHLPSQTISNEDVTVLEEIAAFADDTGIENITIKLEGYTGVVSIRDGEIATQNYHSIFTMIVQTIYYSISCFIVLLFIWALVLIAIKSTFKLTFD